MSNSQCSKRAIVLLLLLGDTPSTIRAWSTITPPSFSSCRRCRHHWRSSSSSSFSTSSSSSSPLRSCAHNRRHERGSSERRLESSSPLTTLRGGGSSSSSSFFDDETTTIRPRRDERHTTTACRPPVSSVPLPFSMLEGATATNDEHPSDDDDDDGRYEDVQTALLAVLAGCRAAHMVQPRGRDGILLPSPSSSPPPSSNDNYHDDPIGIMTKDDASPVTIGDYAAQAAVLHILNTTTFGTTTSNDDDAYIAEEGSDALLGIIQRQQRRQQQQQQRQQQRHSSSSSTFSSTHGRKENSVIENILHVTNRATAGLLIEAGPRTTTTTTTNKKSIPTVQSLLDIIDHRGRGDDDGDDVDVDGSRKRRRVWCLDPIDGTKGFLRGRMAGGQYCVALALIEDGIPIIGILGCPNMPTATNTYTSTSTSTYTSTSIPQYGHWSEDEIMLFDKAEEENRKNEMHDDDDDDDDDRSFALFSSMPKRGCVFLAVRGYGCYEVSLHELEKHYLGNERKRNIPSDGNPSDKKEMEESQLLWTRLQVTTPTPNNNDTNAQPNNVVSNGKFCLGIERTFSDPDGIVLQMACDIQGPTALTTTSDLNDNNVDIVNSVRFDGQGKYGLLARGRDAQYFVRLPRSGYVDWIWDVAAGYVVLTEAGGCVTDVNGKDIDFTNIGNNYGRGEQDNVDVEEEEQRKRTAAKLPDHLRGIVGSSGGVYHQALLDAYARVQAKMTRQYETNK